MRAAVLSIGTELLRGDIVDTNAAFLARELSALGFEVDRQITVGDEMAALTDALTLALSHDDVIVCTGGLGPTEDDLTRQAIAAALGEELYLDPQLLAVLEERFAGMNRRMPARNRQQATLIPSAVAIPNPNGTAPGWLVRHEGRTIVAMPGPPGEMEPMWHDSSRPDLEKLLPGQVAMVSLMTFGLGESAVEEQISDVIHRWPDATIATYAKSNGVQVHVTVRASTVEAAQGRAREAEQALRERLGRAVFGTGDMTLSEAVGELLTELGWTVAVMESATGGTLGSLITNTAGSSDYFVGGIIAYSPAAKSQYGVDRQVMEQFGLISEATAKSMAVAARTELGAQVGVGVTGIAGTESVEGKSPGTCYIAVSTQDGGEAREIRRPGDRATVKYFFAQSALDLLRRQLLEKIST